MDRIIEWNDVLRSATRGQGVTGSLWRIEPLDDGGIEGYTVSVQGVDVIEIRGSERIARRRAVAMEALSVAMVGQESRLSDRDLMAARSEAVRVRDDMERRYAEADIALHDGSPLSERLRQALGEMVDALWRIEREALGRGLPLPGGCS